MKAKVRRRRQTKEKVKELVEGKTAGDTAHLPALQGMRQAKVEERKLEKEAWDGRRLAPSHTTPNRGWPPEQCLQGEDEDPAL